MTDTVRSLTTLQTNLADNSTRAITPQKLRDAVYSSLGVVPYVSKSANYTATENDYVIAVDATGGQVTITLPAAASTRVGKVYTVKKVDSSGNAVSINPNASETLDGSSTTLDITTQYAAISIVNTGSAWLAISEYTP